MNVGDVLFVFGMACGMLGFLGLLIYLLVEGLPGDYEPPPPPKDRG